MAAASFTHTIPFRYPHGGIVIGKGGSTVKAIAQKTHTRITTHKADRHRNMPLPFFLVEAQHNNKLGLHLAVMEIQNLLLTSMMNAEHKSSKSTTQPSTTTPTHSPVIGYPVVNEHGEQISTIQPSSQPSWVHDCSE